MSETGQPGAATPGEHGDGTGPQDDLARSGSGWAPPAAGWARGGEISGPHESAAPWGPPDPTPGWAASSPRHGDLPPPLPGLPAGAEPPARANGHRVNGVDHPADDAPVNRQAPVSAPPGILGEQRRDPGNDRLVVPAQRPAPPVEQPPGPQHGFADPESGPVRRSSDDPSTGRTRWSDPGLPTSAPPAVQVPPVGMAASGFEVPPGFRAPTVDRAAAQETPSAAGPARGWGEHFPPEPPANEPRPFPPATDRPADAAPATGDHATSGDRVAGVDRTPGADRAFRDDRGPDPVAAGTDGAAREFGQDPTSGGFGQDRASRAAGYEQAARGFGPGPGGGRSPDADPVAGAVHAPGVDREPLPDPEQGGPRQPAADRPPTTEPDWTGPNWNRPSWGAAWAPPWSREEHESAGRLPREESTPSGRRAWEEPEPPGRRTREEPEPVARRAREEQPPAWAGEPHRLYEPRAESPRSYDPPHESGRPYDVAQTASVPRPAYERPSAPADRTTGPEAGPPAPAERPAWAAGGPVTAPASAPPLAYAPEAAVAAAPRAEETPDRVTRPFRLRPETAETAPGPPDGPQAAAGPAAEAATSGFGRRDHTPSAPAPTSAPPYAARRSAPEPERMAQPAAADRAPDPASAVLPQRVPSEPDVPVVPEPPAVEPPAETPELARIATHLRREDESAPPRERPEGFDVNAILDAVRGVAGVRDAALRRTPAGAHSLRLDLADGADPAEVSRQVARLLQDRMGLAAAPQNVPGMPAAPAPPVRRRSAEPRGTDSRGPAARPTEPSPAEPRTPGSRVAGSPSEASPPRPEAAPETPRRRRQPAVPHRGRATVEEPGSVSAAPTGTPAGAPAASVGTSYSGGQVTTTETAPSRPLDTGGATGPRVVIDHVQVSTFGLDATVEVRLLAGGESAAGYSTGPAVDGYVLRLCAVAAAAAVDELLRGGETGPDAGPDRGRCFVEHAAVVPFGNCDVATVVVLLVCDGWVEQLVGSALVAGDPRQAVVRATLAAVNRRLEALLA
ncbi:hypothetical protein [Micromonospora peucetia]|uniref:Uncharacterized protein n=1 Tax=Micromonospora peucetia TaxID=47871 RepID=A0A1C6V945_9ACTN|nr:hypothetical protein [Micromonospora peucetia]WSA29848.1 hypothetical protein OIE14_16535 [Micromonospora peucetia]SCL62400.1 hypothetical protein GA0070608_2630 [Micromonospora peucetia]